MKNQLTQLDIELSADYTREGNCHGAVIHATGESETGFYTHQDAVEWVRERACAATSETGLPYSEEDEEFLSQLSIEALRELMERGPAAVLATGSLVIRPGVRPRTRINALEMRLLRRRGLPRLLELFSALGLNLAR